VTEAIQDQLISDYKRDRPTYAAFAQTFASALQQILADADIQHLPLEVRTKTLESFEGKINREDKAGRYSSLVDVTDLSGIRVIVYLKEDVDRVNLLLEKHFLVDKGNTVRKSDEMDADKFGYLSDHFVLSFDEARLQVPEFKRFEFLKAEVQVRTLLQHTWAAIDWKFRYKGNAQPPREVRRRLYRISALLEAADDDFSYVSERIAELRSQYSEEIKEGRLDIELNVESAEAFFKSSKSSIEALGLAENMGFRTAPNKSGGSTFLGTTSMLGINTVDELERAVRISLPKLKKSASKLRAWADDNKASPGFTISGFIRFALLSGAENPVRDKILEAYPFTTSGVNQSLK
jgi:ppGpp synthetase/RelA/SpoT-type nucleotidyltranferase